LGGRSKSHIVILGNIGGGYPHGFLGTHISTSDLVGMVKGKEGKHNEGT
jgi:hypothetical protein